MVHLMHKTNIACLAMTPVAIVLSPSVINMPIDLALGVIFPVHAHIGMNNLISDYVPAAIKQPTRMGMAAFTAISVLGLTVLNIKGKSNAPRSPRLRVHQAHTS